MNSFERKKYHGRVKIGALLHRLGLYRRLLPVFMPRPDELGRRLQSYLNHYYEQAEFAEAVLYLPELGAKFACDIKDHMLWPYLERRAQIYELAEIRHCLAQIRPGDKVVDIGANHGFWGFTLAGRAGSGAYLYLCEANPTLLKRLCRTSKLNSGIASSIFPYAISDAATEEMTFYLPDKELSGLGSTVLHPLAEQMGWLSAKRSITVPARSLDGLVNEGSINGIDMLKIDVEQGEDAVIKGGLNSLQYFRPRLVMMETSQGSWASSTLRDMGYKDYCLDEAGRKRPVDEDFWGNIFFVTDNA